MCGVSFIENDNKEIQHPLDIYLNTMKLHVLNELMLKMWTPASIFIHHPYLHASFY